MSGQDETSYMSSYFRCSSLCFSDWFEAGKRQRNIEIVVGLFAYVARQPSIQYDHIIT